MTFETISAGGCRSYLIGCAEACVAALIDPHASHVERYKALAARDGLRIAYVIDTHTHADHFSAAKQLGGALGAPVVMHPKSPAPFADLRLEDGEALALGKIRLKALHTPGHTADSMCLVTADRVFTGDTLLIGGTGRTDLPTGDPEALYDSLFGKLLTLDSALAIYPAHEYKGRASSTIGEEIANNPRLQQRERAAFVAMMQNLNLSAPDHLTEALRTNMSGGRTVAQMLSEAAAAIPFVALSDLNADIAARRNDFVVLDVREREAFEAAHIPGARHLPRGQLELRVNEAFPDPTLRILAYCEFGKISTLAAATLRQLGFTRAAALDGGMQAWREAGYPTESGPG